MDRARAAVFSILILFSIMLGAPSNLSGAAVLRCLDARGSSLPPPAAPMLLFINRELADATSSASLRVQEDVRLKTSVWLAHRDLF